jgi:hypothetical protein
MSIGDFNPMIQVQTNPSLTLTNVGTSATGTTTNGNNQVGGTINAFWFILGDAIVGFFYTDFNTMNGSGNVTFDLNWTNTWANEFKTPLNFYTTLNGSWKDAAVTSNYLIPHEGQGDLGFIVNGQWGTQDEKQSSMLTVFKRDV